jgi:hypothetical protein
MRNVREALDAVVGTADNTPVGDDADDLDGGDHLADGDGDLERGLLVSAKGRAKVEDVGQNGKRKAAVAGARNSLVENTSFELLADLEAVVDAVLAEAKVRNVNGAVEEAADLDVKT